MYLMLLNGGLTGGGRGSFSQDDNPLGTMLLLKQLGGLSGGLSGGFAPHQPTTAPWGCYLQFGAVHCPHVNPEYYPSPATGYQPISPPAYQPTPPPAYQPPPPPAHQQPPPPSYQPPPLSYHQPPPPSYHQPPPPGY